MFKFYRIFKTIYNNINIDCNMFRLIMSCFIKQDIISIKLRNIFVESQRRDFGNLVPEN